MHLAKPHLIRQLVVVLHIGIFPCLLNATVEEPDAEDLAKRHVVFVEPSHVSEVKIDGEYHLESYAERRGKWGALVSLDYDSYEPIAYQPNFANGSYRSVYGTPHQPTFEAQIAVKRNFALGSLGVEVAVSYFSNDNSDPNGVHSILNLFPLRIGAVYYMDLLGNDPLFVPYVSGGAYTVIYKEKLQGNSLNGNSQVAPYINGGVALSLGWIDRRGERESYENSGLLATYAFLEARKYFSPQAKQDPDFGNDVSGAAGLRVEF